VNIDLCIACGGRVETIIDAVQGGGDESDKWQLILRGNSREKVFLDWGAMEPVEVWDREDESDRECLEDNVRNNVDDDDSWEDSMDQVSGGWEPSEVAEAWGCDDNDDGWPRWGQNTIGDSIETSHPSLCGAEV
jgi:hypothetical protein